MEYEELKELIGKQVIVSLKSQRYRGQLLHVDPSSSMILLQSEKLMIFNKIGYDSIVPCYEQFTQEIPFYEPIRLTTEEQRRTAILELVKDRQVELKDRTIIIEKSCWIDPPFRKIICPDPKRYQLYMALLQPALQSTTYSEH